MSMVILWQFISALLLKTSGDYLTESVFVKSAGGGIWVSLPLADEPFMLCYTPVPCYLFFKE
jgi:hypothetical protein